MGSDNMNFFVARQPIFDCDQNVCAYELLYRNSLDNYYKSVDGDQATSEVINSFFLMGMDAIIDGSKAFINFTSNLLKDEVPTIFDKDTIVIEILEDVEPDKKIIEVCKKMKEEGYTIALDDFVFSPKYLPLLEIADIIKVDFLISPVDERKRLVKIAQRRGIKLLAEKVETREEFEEAVEMGYSYFQGYFFSKPVVLTGTDLPTYATNYFEILEELNQDEPDLDNISAILERDLSLSYKLLKLINSAAFYLREEITSIKNALALLGINEFKKWISLIVLKKASKGKPQEIMKISTIRAKFAELIACKLGFEDNKSQFFMVGMFSMIDVLMNRKLDDILNELPIANKIKWALLGSKGILKDVYDIVLDYERGEWNKVSQQIEKFDLKEEDLSQLFINAVEWSNEVLKQGA